MLFENLRLMTIAVTCDGDHVSHKGHSDRLFRHLESGELTVREWAKLMGQLLRGARVRREAEVGGHGG